VLSAAYRLAVRVPEVPPLARTNQATHEYPVDELRPARWGPPRASQPVLPPSDDLDAFAEVDQIAEARRPRSERQPDGY
jgi:hypothetical protein